MGWKLTLWIVAALTALNAAFLLAGGWNEQSMRVVVRSTARSSIVLFAMAFAASALRRAWSSPTSAWLLRNRRYVGVAFAGSHALHALSLLALARIAPSFSGEVDTLTLVGGGGAYAFIAAMALTSTDAAVAKLGRQNWRRLHLIGGWYVWIIFLQSYAGRVVGGSPTPISTLLFALTLAVFGLRVWAYLRQRSPAAARASAS